MKQEIERNDYNRGISDAVSHIYYLTKNKYQNIFPTIEKILKKEYKNYIEVHGKTKVTKYEKIFRYLETFKYRGKKIDIYDNDYGQSVYFYYKGFCYDCGAYNLCYKEDIKYIIDEGLDVITNLADKYAGAQIRYKDHAHKHIFLYYRLSEIAELPLDKSKEDLIKISKNYLDSLFNNKDFQKSEEERKARGNLFINELMELEKTKN